MVNVILFKEEGRKIKKGVRKDSPVIETDVYYILSDDTYSFVIKEYFLSDTEEPMCVDGKFYKVRGGTEKYYPKLSQVLNAYKDKIVLNSDKNFSDLESLLQYQNKVVEEISKNMMDFKDLRK